MNNQLPNPPAEITLDLEALDCADHGVDLEFPVGSYDEFQMKAETLAVKHMMENKGRRHRSSNWY